MTYDNEAFVVESFRDEPADIRIVTDGRITEIRDVKTEEVLPGETISNEGEWGPSQATMPTSVTHHSNTSGAQMCMAIAGTSST